MSLRKQLNEIHVLRRSNVRSYVVLSYGHTVIYMRQDLQSIHRLSLIAADSLCERSLAECTTRGKQEVTLPFTHFTHLSLGLTTPQPHCFICLIGPSEMKFHANFMPDFCKFTIS